MSDMFNSIIDIVFALVTKVVNIILTPINALINGALSFGNLGTVEDIASICVDFFEDLTEFANWVLSFTGIPEFYLECIIVCWTFILTIPIAVHTFKLAIKWFNLIKIG